MSKNEVKLLDFKITNLKGPETIEAELKVWLDKGYNLISHCIYKDYMTFVLVKTEFEVLHLTQRHGPESSHQIATTAIH